MTTRSVAQVQTAATVATTTSAALATSAATIEQLLSENIFSFYYPKYCDELFFDEGDAWYNLPYLHIFETLLIQN